MSSTCGFVYCAVKRQRFNGGGFANRPSRGCLWVSYPLRSRDIVTQILRFFLPRTTPASLLPPRELIRINVLDAALRRLIGLADFTASEVCRTFNWWIPPHQTAAGARRRLIAYVLTAPRRRKPGAPAMCRVILMTWPHKGTVCFNYGRALDPRLLLSASLPLIFPPLLHARFLPLSEVLPLTWALLIFPPEPSLPGED